MITGFAKLSESLERLAKGRRTVASFISRGTMLRLSAVRGPTKSQNKNRSLVHFHSWTFLIRFVSFSFPLVAYPFL